MNSWLILLSGYISGQNYGCIPWTWVCTCLPRVRRHYKHKPTIATLRAQAWCRSLRSSLSIFLLSHGLVSGLNVTPKLAFTLRTIYHFGLACCSMLPYVVSKNLSRGKKMFPRYLSYCETSRCIKILYPLEYSCFLTGGPYRVFTLRYDQKRRVVVLSWKKLTAKEECGFFQAHNGLYFIFISIFPC